ncbi:ribosome biogenesis GTP-binding protein YihA/YsxC [Pseudaeromonas sharmana]|uniref:Probable GTP-binding protein EngB n=1 Tax=Pseudaeromonas sharmana TaxID=328412 RepID=A0ABV8CMW2_9GAMM
METPTLNFRKVHFVTSAPDIRHLPSDDGVEVAFAGRSNAGKSSALNALTQQKNLARTSKTPGRTQLINLFEVEPGKRLVDLPGYGYAQVPEEMKRKWQASLSEYLQKRSSLKGLVLLMDIRHPLKDTDRQLLGWASGNDLPVLVLLTKADKFNAAPRKNIVQQVRRDVLEFAGDIRVEPFSSLKGIGIDRLASILTDWYLNPSLDDLSASLDDTL